MAAARIAVDSATPRSMTLKVGFHFQTQAGRPAENIGGWSIRLCPEPSRTSTSAHCLRQFSRVYVPVAFPPFQTEETSAHPAALPAAYRSARSTATMGLPALACSQSVCPTPVLFIQLSFGAFRDPIPGEPGLFSPRHVHPSSQLLSGSKMTICTD